MNPKAKPLGVQYFQHVLHRMNSPLAPFSMGRAVRASMHSPSHPDSVRWIVPPSRQSDNFASGGSEASNA